VATYTVTVLGSPYEIAGVTITSQPEPVAPSVAAVDMTITSQPEPVAPLNPEVGAVTAPAAPSIPFPARVASSVGVAWPDELTIHGQATVILG
jgi:hypothetical protein